MDIEVNLLKPLLEEPQTKTISGIDYVCGRLCQKDVVIARCGVGKVNAAICAQTMILTFAPERIINTGVAGSLSNGLDIGDIAVADFVVQSDVDTTALGDPPGFISTVNILKIPCGKRVAEDLAAAAEALSLHSVRGTIATSDSFISDAGKKDYLSAQFGAIACEMEGGSIGHVCYANGIEFGIVRAISDKADGSSHMDYGAFCAMAAKNSSDMICHYLQHC